VPLTLTGNDEIHSAGGVQDGDLGLVTKLLECMCHVPHLSRKREGFTVTTVAFLAHSFVNVRDVVVDVFLDNLRQLRQLLNECRQESVRPAKTEIREKLFT